MRRGRGACSAPARGLGRVPLRRVVRVDGDEVGVVEADGIRLRRRKATEVQSLRELPPILPPPLHAPAIEKRFQPPLPLSVVAFSAVPTASPLGKSATQSTRPPPGTGACTHPKRCRRRAPSCRSSRRRTSSRRRHDDRRDVALEALVRARRRGGRAPRAERGAVQRGRAAVVARGGADGRVGLRGVRRRRAEL